MKKVTIHRDVMVPSSDFCILWKQRKDTCQFLVFRKDANNPKMIFKCSFFDKDLDDNICSHGIEKICDLEDNKDNVIHIDRV